MTETIAVITPAFRAERWIVACVQSVLAQSYARLASTGSSPTTTPTMRRCWPPPGSATRGCASSASGAIGGGASRARNVALERIGTPYAAILDADDRFKPQKLERAVAALQHHAIVSVALDEFDETGRQLRLVGAGPDRALSPARYKWISLSMDSMILWDRRKTDARYDLELTNMTDLELLLQLYRTVPASWHLGTPLHDYLKLRCR